MTRQALQIEWIHSADVDDLRTWKPKKLEEVFICLEMEIGEAGTQGADVFQIVLTTPEALRANQDVLPKMRRGRNTVFPGRDFLIVMEYNWAAIEAELTAMVKECESDTWEQAVEKLTRVFDWEYENHEYVE